MSSIELFHKRLKGELSKIAWWRTCYATIPNRKHSTCNVENNVTQHIESHLNGMEIHYSGLTSTTFDAGHVEKFIFYSMEA